MLELIAAIGLLVPKPLPAGQRHRRRRLLIHAVPAAPASISARVPGSGVGAGAEAENVPLTNRIAALPFWSVAGAKVRFQMPLVGIVIRKAVNVGPIPTNPVAIGLKPPESSKNDGIETAISVFGS